MTREKNATLSGQAQNSRMEMDKNEVFIDVMVKHFAQLFGINIAIKILSAHFIKWKKVLRELYDPELK